MAYIQPVRVTAIVKHMRKGAMLKITLDSRKLTVPAFVQFAHSLVGPDLRVDAVAGDRLEEAMVKEKPVPHRLILVKLT